MAKSNKKNASKTYGQELSYSWLGTGIKLLNWIYNVVNNILVNSTIYRMLMCFILRKDPFIWKKDSSRLPENETIS